MSKIYTRKGDMGQTELFGGERVSKASARVDVYGNVDELNSLIGLARSQSGDGYCDGLLAEIQNQLHAVCAELASVAETRADLSQPLVSDGQVGWIEQNIDKLEQDLHPLENFILPGGNSEAAFLHLARTVCRRVERKLVGLAEKEAVRSELIRYFNRLSDFFFVMARHANHRAGVVEVQWMSCKDRNDR